MTRFTSGISILLLSALSATAATAAENRLEYQLHLTHNPAPAIVQPIEQSPKLSMSQPQQSKQSPDRQAEQTQALSDRDRLIYEYQHQVVLPAK